MGDHNETLNVRWATVDPNPVAQKREAARIEEQAAEAIRRALPASYVAELEGRKYDGHDPEEERKRRKIDGSFGLKGYEAPDEQKKLEAPVHAEDEDEDDGAPLQLGAPPKHE